LSSSICQIVSHVDDFLAQELDQLCSYEIPGREYFDSKWDGIVHLYRYRTKRFPVGMIQVVKKAIERYYKYRGEVVIVDERPEPKHVSMPDNLREIVLRDYQIEAVETGMELGSGLLNCCVGSGKTEIAIEMIRRRQTYSAFLVHRKELLYQAKERIEKRLGIKVGQVGDGVVDLQPVTVMMFQALSRYIEDDKELMVKDAFALEEDTTEIKNIKEILGMFSFIVVDESAHVPARTFYKVVTAFDNCRFRYGLSASVDRDDGQEKAIYAGVGSIIHRITASELIKRKFLVPPKIKVLRLERKIYHGDRYQTVYKDYITDNEKRNGIIVEQIVKLAREGRKILVLVDRIKHGETLQKMLKEYSVNLENPVNIRLEKVKGELSTKIRNKVMSDFKGGELDCVIATASLYQEGVDIPIADALIVAGGGKSRTKVRQMVGRVIRTHPDKKDAVVIDFLDQAKYLTSHAKKRLETYREEPEFEVVVE